MAEQSGEPERRIGRGLRSTVLGRRRVTLGVGEESSKPNRRLSRTADLDQCASEGYNSLRGATIVTTLLQQAFAEASNLSQAEQDLLASRLLAELAAENQFDTARSASSQKLAVLGREALAGYRAGQTQELDPDRL